MTVTFANLEHRKLGLEALTAVKKVLETKNTPYWIDYGTLLGCIREQNLISIDWDIDIGVHYEDLEGSTIDALKSNFKITTIHRCSPFIAKKYLSVKEAGTPSMYCMTYKGLIVDIAVYHDCQGAYKGHIAHTVKNRLFRPPTNYILPTIEKEMQGIKVPVPKNYDKYLTFIYGTWKIPENKHREMVDG